jgi:hypothetical protein
VPACHHASWLPAQSGPGLVPAKTAVQGCQGLPPLNGFERPGLRHMEWHGRDDKTHKVDYDVDSRQLGEMPMG